MLASALLAGVVLYCSGASAGQPSAADRATARALAFAGQRALDKKDYRLALDRFTRANMLVQAPTLALRIARAQVGLGLLVEAHETYQHILRTRLAPGSPAVFEQAVDEARKEDAELATRLGWITIEVRGPQSFTVTIDGSRVPDAEIGVRRAIDPGAHLVHLAAKGYQPVDSRVSVAEGQAGSLTLAPELAPQSSGRGRAWQRTAGWSAIGVGTVGLIVGSIEGAVAISKHSRLDEACPDAVCPPGQRSELDSYRTSGAISTMGFIVAGVGYGAGITLLLTAPASRSSGYVAPYVGAGTLGAKGRF